MFLLPLICCYDVDDEMFFEMLISVSCVCVCKFGGGMIWLGTADIFDCVIHTDTCGLI